MLDQPHPDVQAQDAGGISLLPVEIIIEITKLLENGAKCSLMRVSRFFKEIVQPMLYEVIRLDLSGHPEDSRRLFRTLAKRQDLAQKVAHLSGCIGLAKKVYPPSRSWGCLGQKLRYVWRDREARKASADHFRNLVTSFESITNIRSIRFHDHDPHHVIYERIAPVLAKMDLWELILRRRFWPGNLAPILRPYINLTNLKISTGLWDLSGISTTDLPHLTFLSAPLTVAKWLVPGRPVTRLRLISLGSTDAVEQEKAYQAFTHSTGPVKDLTIPIYWCQEAISLKNTAGYIARYIPTVESLTLRGFSKTTSASLDPDLVSDGNSGFD